jgi:putative restriction endonuclease
MRIGSISFKDQNFDEVNFWQPNSLRTFRALGEGELFLFKLHAPQNYIVGGGSLFGKF